MKRVNHSVAHLSDASSGFTIIELMIATLVFSTILVVITFGVIRFTNSYYKGVNSSTTQKTAQSVVDAVTQAVQFSTGSPTPSTASDGVHGYFCVGGMKYIYVISVPYDAKSAPAVGASNAGGIYETTNTDACSSANPGPSVRQLLADNMRVTSLAFVPTTNTSIWQFSLSVAYGDDDLLTATSGPNVQCKTQTGSQFCAAISLSTVAQQRVM